MARSPIPRLTDILEAIAAPIMWKLVRDDLPRLEAVCVEELVAERDRDDS